MGAESLRNLATIGGNVCNASPKADLPVPLIMMDARGDSCECYRFQNTAA